MKKITRQCGTTLLLLFLLTGCASQEEVLYLQGVPENYKEKITQDSEIKIHTDDLLSIMINSKDIELVQMLNMPMVSYHISNSITGYGGGQQRVLGYLVDKEGYIDFPQLGRIEVAGLTRSQLVKKIKDELMSKGLVKDPIVTVQFLNFKVSVMGEVTKPGTFDVTSDRITLFDALSRAGDLTIYGKRENVKVIREENGERTIATLDLRNSDILDSPYFYLQQNDVVYVEPNKAKIGQSEINQNRTIGTFASILSVLISLAVLLFK